jgi:hypothetical protein
MIHNTAPPPDDFVDRYVIVVLVRSVYYIIIHANGM